MRYYLDALSNYWNFSGRSRRREYWYFVLFNVLFALLLMAVDVAIGLNGFMGDYGLLQGLYLLAVLIPSMAACVRRLHDTGHSGLWILIAAIPILGPIVLLLFLVRDSEGGSNRYGRNPKARAAQPAEGAYAGAQGWSQVAGASLRVSR